MLRFKVGSNLLSRVVQPICELGLGESTSSHFKWDVSLENFSGRKQFHVAVLNAFVFFL
jgi:hypothetical protein